MTHLSKKILCLFAPLTCSALLSAALFPRESPQNVIRVNVNLVLVDATVKNKAGQIMVDLKQENFELHEDGTPQKIEIFSRDEIPLDVVLVLDLSDSIGPFLVPLRQAANIALSALKPEDQVALFTFSTEAQMRVPFTLDKSQIADMIGGFQTGGATNINDAIFLPAQYLLNAPQKDRRAIILISDDVGTSSGGQGTRDIVTEAIASDAVVYNFGDAIMHPALKLNLDGLKIPGYPSPETRMAAAMTPGLVDIRKVVEQTGGEVFNVPDVAHLEEGFRALIQRIKTRYTLGYYDYTNATAALGKPHKIDVRLGPSFGKKGHDYTALSRS